MRGFEESFAEDQRQTIGSTAYSLLGTLVQSSQYVGEVYSIGYETALVQIHDFHRREVGGIPSLSFLIATRVNGDITDKQAQKDFDYKQEDTSVLLLRVIDAAPLLTDMEAQRIREESARRVSGEAEKHWDSETVMDAATHNMFSFAV